MLTIAHNKTRLYKFIPLFAFLFIVCLLYAVNAFPALYGDEYDSLSDAQHLLANVHAIGYFAQLSIWSSLFKQDWALRLLSIFWLAIGIYWLYRWLVFEELGQDIINLTILLAILNPFLWMYGFQIRFYSYFIACSVLFVWRCRVTQRGRTTKNILLLLASGFLLLLSHLFGVLVILTTMLDWFWIRLGKKQKWYLLAGVLLVLLIVSLPPVRQLLVAIVYRMSNPYAVIPQYEPPRGWSLAMFAKVPLTFYFFLFGERVYPLWWQVTIPGIAVAVVAVSCGLYRIIRRFSQMSIVFGMLLNLPLMFLVLDPLAPSGLQGAVPRYVIFVLPCFLLLLAIGAQVWRGLPYALVAISLVGLISLVLRDWSYGGTDLADWPRYLSGPVTVPEQTCVVADDRAISSAARYLPVGTKLVHNTIQECLGFATIILASNDYRLSQIRYFDEMQTVLVNDYVLVSNQTLFPAQVTTFEKSPEGNRGHIFPSRLDLSEQDLRFPILATHGTWTVAGFMRLDTALLH